MFAVQALLETGIPRNEASLSHALVWAARGGQLETCALLLAHGANPESRGRGHPLCSAAGAGHLEVCELLLAHGAQANAENSSALVAAAVNGRAEVCQLLLQAGASPSAAEDHGPTALQAAADVGIVEVCRLLLQAGADVSATGGLGSSALCIAAREGHEEVCRLLLAQPGVHAGGDSSGALATALERGHPQVCLLLLEAGVSASNICQTLLKRAAEMGDAKLFQLLLQRMKYSVLGLSWALEAAAKQGNVDICRMILARALDQNEGVTERCMNAALRYASDGGHTQVLQLLREQKEVQAKARSMPRCAFCCLRFWTCELPWMRCRKLVA